MRPLAILLACLAIAACQDTGSGNQLGALPQWVTGLPDPSPEFGVTALPGPVPAGYAAFNRVSPDVADAHARSICTQGYQKTGEQTLPGEQTSFLAWRVKCNTYAPSL
jgi:hypothetical protein